MTNHFLRTIIAQYACIVTDAGSFDALSTLVRSYSFPLRKYPQHDNISIETGLFARNLVVKHSPEQPL